MALNRANVKVRRSGCQFRRAQGRCQAKLRPQQGSVGCSAALGEPIAERICKERTAGELDSAAFGSEIAVPHVSRSAHEWQRHLAELQVEPIRKFPVGVSQVQRDLLAIPAAAESLIR